MKTVTWTIQLDAESDREAAEQALAVLRDSDSTATVFVVDGNTVDLSEPKRYEFTLTLTGYGADEQSAWLDAVEGFCADPGENPEPGVVI